MRPTGSSRPVGDVPEGTFQPSGLTAAVEQWSPRRWGWTLSYEGIPMAKQASVSVNRTECEMELDCFLSIVLGVLP